MTSTTTNQIPIAYLLRPLFGGDGCLRDYSDRLGKRFLKDTRFLEMYAALTPEQRVRRAEDGAQARLIAEVQGYGMDYHFDAQNERGVLFVTQERRAPAARAKLPELSDRIKDVCGNRLRYELA